MSTYEHRRIQTNVPGYQGAGSTPQHYHIEERRTEGGDWKPVTEPTPNYPQTYHKLEGDLEFCREQGFIIRGRWRRHGGANPDPEAIYPMYLVGFKAYDPATQELIAARRIAETPAKA